MGETLPVSHMGEVWILDTHRAGEMAQCKALADMLGLPCQIVPLQADFSLPEQIPDTQNIRLILSFGNAVRAALALRARCKTVPAIVQIGRPSHIPVTDLDLIIIPPQDDYPAASNVLRLRFPLNGADKNKTFIPQIDQKTRHGGTVVLYGAPSRQFFLNEQDTYKLLYFSNKLAQAHHELLHVLTSPRTPVEAEGWLKEISKTIPMQIYSFRKGVNPFQNFLREANRFVVTGDSASMLADACRTGVPVWVFPLRPKRRFMTRLQVWADRLGLQTIRNKLIEYGWLGSGTCFDTWHATLAAQNYIRLAAPQLPLQALNWSPEAFHRDDDMQKCYESIMKLPLFVARKA
ncbi:nucleoside-diphosphate sugar epimerase [Acetobacter pomorum]|uniref:Nucleoside-diphosphate sugar epimerase n=1 Tax=Acetobacter pomorum TaxID=65959 RepID=A0A2G4R9X4_9PROT|nr:ELM1/GtrOC1 family putative glycosyltransferase [Acetobacter pomorum]PHY93332.1 nucleoside-diphosphate sugar epimerase [Acetobacter pomorum]GBR45824.1 nucleoside-diphosphate-sugar epimerase [Acetobacter pomorum DSM 11825]